jgi:hypothetical protein
MATQNSYILPDAVNGTERTMFLGFKEKVSKSCELATLLPEAVAGIRIGESYQPRCFFACFNRSIFSGVSQ